MTFTPKLAVAATASTIPSADPRPLFWVTGVVLGVLALWVLYVVFAGETHRAAQVDGVRPGASAAKPGGDGPK